MAIPKYTCICQNLPEVFVFHSPFAVPCLLENLVTYFNVYTKLYRRYSLNKERPWSEGTWGCFIMHGFTEARKLEIVTIFQVSLVKVKIFLRFQIRFQISIQ